MKTLCISFCLLLCGLAILFSCRKESDLVTDSSAKLDFSAPLISFYTIFTQTGSTTKQLKVYNHNAGKVMISSIRLAGGQHSNFRINVDGSPKFLVKDVTLEAGDSIFIFIEVTVDPQNSNNPMEVNDSIVFQTNGNVQDVNLRAWGQDVYLHKPAGTSSLYPLDCSDFKTDKPHLIYGYAYVDSGCVITIPQNCRIYFAKGAGLAVAKAGSLKVMGTKDEPVIFQGMRQEKAFSDIPGQWERIWLSAGSINNEFNYAIIKNGIVGIQVDTLASLTIPTLRISNSIIKNMSSMGLWTQGSFVDASNCVFANCGQFTAAITLGGWYRFRNCTFANYWSQSNRQSGQLVLNNFYVDVNKNVQPRQMQQAYFGNCIIYGSEQAGKPEGEIILNFLENSPAGWAEYTLDHCLVRVEAAFNTTDNHCKNVIRNLDPHFKNTQENDYSFADGSSPAIDKGDLKITKSNPEILTDILGNSRNAGSAPDLGAYEFTK